MRTSCSRKRDHIMRLGKHFVGVAGAVASSAGWRRVGVEYKSRHAYIAAARGYYLAGDRRRIELRRRGGMGVARSLAHAAPKSMSAERRPGCLNSRQALRHNVAIASVTAEISAINAARHIGRRLLTRAPATGGRRWLMGAVINERHLNQLQAASAWHQAERRRNDSTR